MKEVILRISGITKCFPLSLDVLTVLIKTNPKDLHRHYPFFNYSLSIILMQDRIVTLVIDSFRGDPHRQARSSTGVTQFMQIARLS